VQAKKKKNRTVTLRRLAGRLKKLAQNTIGGGKVIFFGENGSNNELYCKNNIQSNMKYICS
jgi:hypothetical protein